MTTKTYVDGSTRSDAASFQTFNDLAYSALGAVDGVPLTPALIRTALALVYATQADQETATSTVAPVTPGRQQFHPSAAKGWAKCQFDGVAAGSYNVSSLTDNGAGDVTVNWTTAFSGVPYAAVATAVIDPAGTSGSVRFVQAYTTGYLAGSTRIWCGNGSFGGADATNINVVAFGDQ